MDRGTNRAQWEGEGGRGCEGRGGVEGGGQCYATCLVRTSILLRSDSPPPSLGPLGSRVRGRPLVLRGVAANLAWVGGALRTASREGRVASLASLGIVFPDPARLPACPARLADKISSPSHWWSIGTRVVWHLLRVSPGAPTNLACEGRVACLNGLVRGACQPRFVEAALGTHTHPAAFVAGARHVPVGWTALVECVSPTKAGRTQGQCRRDAAREAAPAEARLAPVARGSSSERPGSLYWQTSG